MTEDQERDWVATADLFRQEVKDRLHDVTDTGELESLVRVFGIAYDVESSMTQLGYKEQELELERYRIELSIAAHENECEADCGEVEDRLIEEERKDEDEKK